MGKGEGKGGFFGLLRELGRCIQCILCLPVIGVVLLVVGVALMVSLHHDGRRDSINNYNAAIRNWNDFARQNFSQSRYFMNTGVQISLDSTTQPDPINDRQRSGDPDWLAFTALRYSSDISFSTAGVSPLEVVSCPSGPGPCITERLPAVSGTNTQFRRRNELNCIQSNRFTSDCLPRSSRATRYCYCSDACHYEGGVWDESTGQCEINQFLNQICVRLDTAQRVDRSRGNGDQGGCRFANGWAVAQYSTTRTSSVRLVVRSNGDPHVEMEQLTRGSLYFGLTQKEKALIGLALVVVGSLLFAIPVMVVCCICRSRSRPTAQYVQPPSVVVPNAYNQYGAQQPQAQSFAVYAPPPQYYVQPPS